MAELNSLEELGSAVEGAEAPEATAPEAPVYEQKLDEHGRAYATGKRKDAIARVWIKPGSGKIVINKRELTNYFARPVLQMILRQPIVAADRDGQYDVIATVSGGGLSGRLALCVMAFQKL